MKTRDYLLGLALLVCAAITISLWMKSCELSEEKQLKKQIKNYEDSIRTIQTKRDANNATVIPFSDSARTKVVESVNAKTGFDLSVRKPR